MKQYNNVLNKVIQFYVNISAYLNLYDINTLLFIRL